MTVLGYPAHHSSAHLHPVKPYDPRFFEAFAHVDQPLGQVIELVIVFGRRKGQQLPQELGKPVCRIGQFPPPGFQHRRDAEQARLFVLVRADAFNMVDPGGFELLDESSTGIGFLIRILCGLWRCLSWMMMPFRVVKSALTRITSSTKICCLYMSRVTPSE